MECQWAFSWWDVSVTTQGCCALHDGWSTQSNNEQV
jgi:hypothetical protein